MDPQICDHVTIVDVVRAAMQGFDVARPDCGPQCRGMDMETAHDLWASGYLTPEQTYAEIRRPTPRLIE